jgi:adenylylsulfate kinase
MNRHHREERRGHPGGVFWFTGLSGSGKTVIAREVERTLADRGLLCTVIDGDLLRAGLNRDLGYTETDRQENVRRAAEVAAMFLEHGFIVLVPMITPYASSRAQLRRRFADGNYAEIYVRCPLDTCERRDPKGLYRRARTGEIEGLTGIDAPYEPPMEPDLELDSERDSIDACTAAFVGFVETRLRRRY